MSWVDLALIDNEPSLRKAIEGLTAEKRESVINDLLRLLELSKIDADQTLIRLLLERARPFAMPGPLWGRPADSSDDIRKPIERNFKALRVDASGDRIKAVQRMYINFVQQRDERKLTKADLERQDFRCAHCGLSFCNEELQKKGFESPYGLRGKPKTDKLKPHWAKPEYRAPTLDHRWPIASYGSNDPSNLYVLCRACNEGKAHCLGREQLPSFIGLLQRAALLGKYPISTELFYAQLCRQPTCERSGRAASETELTVALRDPDKPAFLDNLLTLESPGH